MHNNLTAYYHLRASEYEKIYARPERQEALAMVTTYLQQLFAEKQVLEIACGTGYWTERIARTADAILATDINESVLEIARAKDYGEANVRFKRYDLYELPAELQSESLFGGFIWSHIPVQELEPFLQKINSLVRPGGLVVFLDNQYVAGSNHPIACTDAFGNTYQDRRLEDGSAHRVLKNFPAEPFLRDQLKTFGKNVQFLSFSYYWIIWYQRA